MCGRFSLDTSWEEIVEHFNLERPQEMGPKMPPRYNIAPTQPIIMVGNGDDGVREGLLARWGLIPSWVKDPKEFTLLINARAETAIDKPSFKTAMRHRRMLVPASGFYEWKRYGKGQKSQPFWVRPKNGGLVAFGALMETYADQNGSEIDTGCIISTDTNETFKAIHHRLPMVVHPQNFDRWLDCKSQEPREILDLMQPVDNDYFECIPVSDAVNKVVNTGVEIQQRVEPIKPLPKKPNNQLSMF
ncbi:MAG: SOS response-associated peptidase [Rhizobiaceae bacterium]